MVIDDQPSESSRPARQWLRCHTVALGGFKHLNYVRDLPPFAIEERFGQPEKAELPTPSETLLVALGSCLGSRIYANAAAGNIVVDQLDLDVEVDFYPNSIWDAPGLPPRSVGFSGVRVVVRIKANASHDTLQSIINHAVMWSPVANTLHDPVHLDIVSQTDPTLEDTFSLDLQKG